MSERYLTHEDLALINDLLEHDTEQTRSLLDLINRAHEAKASEAEAAQQ